MGEYVYIRSMSKTLNKKIESLTSDCGRVSKVDDKTYDDCMEFMQFQSTSRAIDVGLGCYFINEETVASVTDTRVNDLADGIFKLYMAVCKLDTPYLLSLAKDERFRCIIQAANLLPELEQSIDSYGSRDLIYSEEDK